MKPPTLVVIPQILLSTLAAQAAPTSSVVEGDPRVAVHSNTHQPGEAPYGTWAAGAAYKASFAGGMTFYPQLGRDYPHNQPLAWRTTSIRVGEVELLDRAASAPSLGDYRVEYQLGRVVEAYDVRAEGLEQTFVLAQRPEGSGDLRITGAVTTGLWADPVAERDGDLLFHDDAGTPIVRYGRALAVDADGDTFAMTTTYSGGNITLRLPAAALAEADFPLVVDPLLAPALSMSQPNAIEVGEVDGAVENRNATLNGAYCMTRHYSATDADVIARIGAADLSGAVTRFSDLSASTSADHGRVAFVAATNKWLVCYQSLTLSTQVMQVRAAMFSGGASAPTTTSSVALVEAAGLHDWRPCVGGIAAGGAGAQALIAFQRESGIATFGNTTDSEVWAALFDTSGALGSFGTPFPVLDAGIHDYERPAINRAAEGGAAFSWFVACQQLLYASPAKWFVRSTLVTNAGAVASSAWTTGPTPEHQVGPVVDGRNGNYLIAFAACDGSLSAPTDPKGTAILCARLVWPHGQGTASGSPVQTLQQHPLRILETGGIAHHASTRSHWTVAWRSSSTAPAIYAARVGYRGVALQTPELVASTAASIPGLPSVVNDDTNDATTILYQRHQGSITEVWARTWINPTTAPSQLSATNCSAAVLDWTGPGTSSANSDQWIGSAFSRVSVTAAPANSLHLMLVGTATVNTPIVDPVLGTNCSLLVPAAGPDHLGFLPTAVGASVSWTLPLPESLPAMTVHFQDWVLEPSNNKLWGTRRLSVPLTK